jgi:hypothetical protein
MTPSTMSRRLFQAAFFCGVAPCFAGTLISGLWLLTRHPGLVIAGAAILLGGAVSLLLGAILLALRVRSERALGSSEESVYREKRLGGIVLLANLFVAALLVGAVFVSSESYSVSVRNRGAVAIDSFAIIDQSGSERRELGAFAPGEERTVAIRVRGKTSLTYEMLRFGQVSTGTISGYTEPELAADQWATVTIGDDGKALVEQSLSKGP